jgi:hypothetical protein
MDTMLEESMMQPGVALATFPPLIFIERLNFYLYFCGFSVCGRTLWN